MRCSPNNKSSWKKRLKKVPGLVPLVRLCRFAVSPGYRSEWRLKRTRPDNLFQPYALTAPDRYPVIFSFVRNHVQDQPSARILSYGCSTGEEVFSLRRYFPLAEIVGMDINPRSIAVCRKKQGRIGDTRIRFAVAATPDAEADSGYDAVFCMAVLRHGELGASNAESCGHLIRFADFERTVASLCRCLKPGGYLAVMGSNFRFADTASASGFDAVHSINDSAPRADTPLYGPDNRRLHGVVYNEAVFRKRGQA
jgi:SAM-dependent methyltransferase